MTVWQADMRLAVRGLPIVMSEQLAEHWCPVILTQEASADTDTADTPIPVVSTFLFPPNPDGPGSPSGDAGQYTRYVLTLRVYQVVQQPGGAFDFRNHVEQVSDWADSLIVDIGDDGSNHLHAWTGWNAEVAGALNTVPRMPNDLELGPDETSGQLVGRVPLPAATRGLAIFGPDAGLRVTVRDRETVRAERVVCLTRRAAPAPGRLGRTRFGRCHFVSECNCPKSSGRCPGRRWWPWRRRPSAAGSTRSGWVTTCSTTCRTARCAGRGRCGRRWPRWPA